MENKNVISIKNLVKRFPVGGDYFSSSTDTFTIAGNGAKTLEFVTSHPTSDTQIKFRNTHFAAGDYMIGLNSGLNASVFVIASGSTTSDFDNPIIPEDKPIYNKVIDYMETYLIKSNL